MTHLRIELNNIQENVSSAVILKLYELVHNNTLDNTSNLAGNLYTTGTYQHYVDLLTTEFPDLTITANLYFAYFADPEVARVMTALYGSNGELYDSHLTGVSKLANNLFKNNSTVRTFNELGRYRSITTLGDHCFNGSSIELIDLSNITTFESSAMTGATSIVNISAPNLTSGACFDGCSNLETVIMGSSFTSISDYFVHDCRKLTTVTGLSNAVTVGRASFEHTDLLATTDIDFSKITNTGQQAFNGSNLVIDGDFLELLTIGNYSFLDSKFLNGIVALPKVTDIGIGAFYHSNVVSVNLTGSSITSIPNYTFRTCSSLTTVTLPDSVSLIGNNAFDGCSSLLYLNFSPLSSVSIGDSAFAGCTNLISTGLTSVPAIVNGYIFLNCSSLTDTFDLSSVTSIYRWGFGNCPNVVLTGDLSNITFLGERAFYKADLSSIQNITLSSILSMENGVFMGAKINSLTIPNITVSGNAQFDDSTITSLSLPDCITVYSTTAYNCPNLLTLNLPVCLTIQREAFRNSKISTINLPSIVTLESSVFYNNSASTITVDLGPNITSIGWEALGNDSSTNKITSLTVRATTPPTFGYDNSRTYFSNCTIYVPAASVNTYKAASGWSYFANRILAIPSLQ